MKKLKILLFTFIVIIHFSCEENFSPIGDFEEKYTLNCIIRGDNRFQTATLTKTYFGDGKDAYSNTEDPAVKDAIIKVWLNPDSVVIMRDTLIQRPDGSRYNEPELFHYVENFKPSFGKDLRIEALLPSGKRLVAVTHTPDSVEFNKKADSMIPTGNKKNVEISWASNQADLYYVPRLLMTYYKTIDGQKERHVVEIPQSFVKYNDELIPNYPKPSVSPNLVIERDAVYRILSGISEGDEEKHNYSIRVQADVDVMILDRNLKSYYQSAVDGLDQFTVRLDGSDFSNIRDGLGIFGSYVKISKQIPIDINYIESFGYTATFF